MYELEYEKLLGIIFAVIIILSLIAAIFHKFFPKNKFSNIPLLIMEWIQDNIRI